MGNNGHQRIAEEENQIAKRCPRVAVVVLAPELDDDQLFQAIKSGAVAY